MSPLDPSTVIPFRAEAGRRRSWRDGLGAGVAEAALSLALNLAAVTSLVHLAFPRELSHAEPQSIAVDLVSDVPKTSRPSGDKPAPSDAAIASAAPQEKTTPPTPPPRADDSPARPATPPPPQQPAPAPAQADHGAKQPSGAAVAALPASIEGNRDPAPRLVAAPTTPQAAITQADKPTVANAETKPAKAPKVTEQAPPPAPDVLASAAAAADNVPSPSSAAAAAQAAPEPSGEDKREAENTARLAAALPFAATMPPTFARAAQSASGAEAEQRYRGSVYSQFHKADDLIEQARTAHLRGQTVVEFSVDDAGALTAVRVAVSSGNPDVDRTAEDIIRRSAPFPPPPPGAQRVFSPAIRLGLDD